jgi:VanZ family protein
MTTTNNSLYLMRWLLTPLITVALVVLLLQPGEQAVTDTGLMQGPPSLWRDVLFTIGHVAWFGLLVVLWRWTLMTRFDAQSALVLAVLIAVVLGTSTEYAQIYIPNRGATLEDLLANGVGVVAGVIAIRFYEPTKR